MRKRTVACRKITKNEDKTSKPRLWYSSDKKDQAWNNYQQAYSETESTTRKDTQIQASETEPDNNEIKHCMTEKRK